jgi:hypothetical protein
LAAVDKHASTGVRSMAMAKASSSKPATQSAKSQGAAHKGKGRPDKSMQKTSDLIKGNGKAKASGKGKEKAVLGEVAQAVERELSDL